MNSQEEGGRVADVREKVCIIPSNNAVDPLAEKWGDNLCTGSGEEGNRQRDVGGGSSPRRRKR